MRRVRPPRYWLNVLGIVCAFLFVSGCAELSEFLKEDQQTLTDAAPVPETEVPTLPPAPKAATAPKTNRETITVPKTGAPINERAARRKSGGNQKGGDVSLNFVGVPVEEVVRSVLGEMLGLNYTIGANVAGKITLRTTQPIRRGAVLPTLQSVLRLNKVVIVEENGFYNVLTQSEALSGKLVPRLGSGRLDKAFGVQIVPLQFVSATEMSDILKPLSKEGTVLRVDTERNLLLLSGTKQERNNLLEIVEIFDVDWLRGRSFSLIPLESASAADIVKELTAIFGEEASGPLAGLVRFVPIERTKSILAIATNDDYLRQAQEWVKRFDIGGDTTARRLFVYNVQNGQAMELAELLNQVFGTEDTTDQRYRRDTGDIRPGLRPATIRSNTGTGTGLPRTETTRQSGRRNQQATAYREPRRNDPRNAGSSQYPDALSTDGAPRIIADDINNALLIRATDLEYRQVLAALQKLDIVPLQVLIEATIAEVTLRNQLRYGVQWFFNTGDSQLSLSEAATGAVASQFPGFSYVFSNSPDVRVVLNALEDITDVNVISAPQLMVLDNRTAELQVGDQVPIATQSAVSIADPDAPIVNSIELRDTGIVLRVTPRVNASGMVNLEIEQEVSDVVATTTSGIDSPTIQQRRIHSSVVIQSGQTIALGGLISEDNTKTGSGLPFLSRIPLIGSLFGDKTLNSVRTELLVLITPRVVRNPEESRKVTEELRNKVRAIKDLYTPELKADTSPQTEKSAEPPTEAAATTVQ